MSAGTVTAGAVESATVTLNEPVEVLPWTSRAEQLTVVEPKPKWEPAPGVQDAPTGPSTTSDPLAENPTLAPVGPVASAVIAEGRLRIGPCVSSTFTVKVDVPTLPATSEAVQVAVVVASRAKV